MPPVKKEPNEPNSSRPASIQQEPRAVEPNCPKCGDNRQVWTNQITGKKTCHRLYCHTEIPDPPKAEGDLVVGLKRIVETSNDGSVFPDERFLDIHPLPAPEAHTIVKELNQLSLSGSALRIWKVVDLGYQLQPGWQK
jgi:hypothetical protein